jgi:hypothetical protein
MDTYIRRSSQVDGYGLDGFKMTPTPAFASRYVQLELGLIKVPKQSHRFPRQ